MRTLKRIAPHLLALFFILVPSVAFGCGETTDVKNFIKHNANYIFIGSLLAFIALLVYSITQAIRGHSSFWWPLLKIIIGFVLLALISSVVLASLNTTRC